MWKVSPSDKAEKPAEEGQLITRADKMKLLLPSEKKKEVFHVLEIPAQEGSVSGQVKSTLWLAGPLLAAPVPLDCPGTLPTGAGQQSFLLRPPFSSVKTYSSGVSLLIQ